MSSKKEQLKRLLSLKRLWLLLTLPVSILLYVLAHAFPAFAEFWARYVYVIFSHLFHSATKGAPVSVAEIAVFVAPILVLAMLILGIVHIVRSPGNRLYAGLKAFVVEPSLIASILLLIFMVNCGVNYGRLPFADACGLEVRESSAAELQALCLDLIDSANKLRESLPEDENGVMQLSDSVKDTGETARQAFEVLSKSFPTLPEGYGVPKAVMASRGMSYLNITGIFFPFTMEANVNVDVVDYNIPFTMCHELTHLRGYMREDEANFVAYLACLASMDKDFNYSGALSAFIYSINALEQADPERAAAVYPHISEAVWRDLNANNAYWQQFETPLAEVSSNVNSAYLQANGTEDGVQSYGRMVDLLLAWRRAGGVV